MKTVLSEPLAIDAKAIKKAASIYRAIHHTLRLQIIEIVHKAGKINVTPIIQKLKLEQSAVSAHLKILRESKLLKAERQGNGIFYSINYGQINLVSDLSEKLIPYGTNQLNSIKSSDCKFTSDSDNEDAVTFTPIEVKMIRLICQENTNEEIARKLGLSRRTVEEYKGNIIKKMKVRNSVGILFFAIKKGLFKI